MIECAQAHADGRPQVRAKQHASLLTCLFYMWSGSMVTLNGREDANSRQWVEGCRFIPRDAGTQAPDYGGAFPGSGADTCMRGQDLTASDMVYVQNNDYGGISRGSFGAAEETDRGTALSLMDLPEDYSSRFRSVEDFWSDANLSESLNLLGANPTTPDAIDTDIRDSIINDDGVWIDDVDEVPSGGYPVLSSQTHATGALGTTLQSHLEAKSWWATRHSVAIADGFTNRTKLEIYLDNFVSGVPGADPS